MLIATLIPPLLGYQRFVVVGGSMEPTIHRGSVIFDEIVPVEDLRPGDVITYVPPGHHTPSTHRIISRELDPQGSWRFRTKGDANAAPDAQPFVLERPGPGPRGARDPLRRLPLHGARDRDAPGWRCSSRPRS